MRWLLRWPLLLYKVRLGWLLGHRFLVVGHVGRHSGRLHHTVVEVLRYDGSADEAVVMTPWPRTANWYRNLLVRPAAEIWIGARCYRSEQRMLSAQEITALLDDYARKGRAEGLGLRRLMGWSLDLNDSARYEIASRVGAVAFRPKLPARPSEPTSDAESPSQL